MFSDSSSINQLIFVWNGAQANSVEKEGALVIAHRIAQHYANGRVIVLGECRHSTYLAMSTTNNHLCVSYRGRQGRVQGQRGSGGLLETFGRQGESLACCYSGHRCTRRQKTCPPALQVRTTINTFLIRPMWCGVMHFSS